MVTSTFMLGFMKTIQEFSTARPKTQEIPDKRGSAHFQLDRIQRQTTKDDKGNIQTSVYGAAIFSLVLTKWAKVKERLEGYSWVHGCCLKMIYKEEFDLSLFRMAHKRQTKSCIYKATALTIIDKLIESIHEDI